MSEYHELRHRLYRFRHYHDWESIFIFTTIIGFAIFSAFCFTMSYTYVAAVDSASCQDIPDLIEKYGAAERIENKIKVCEYLERHR